MRLSVSPSLFSSLALVHVIVLVSILLLPLTQSSTLEKADNGDLVDKICKKTPFYDLCSSTLHSDPLSHKTDLKGLALIMVNNVIANATDTLNYIEGLIKETSDRQMEQDLAFCAESYIPVVKYTLPQAADAVSQGRFGFASYCIADAEKEVAACDKKFKGAAQPPLSDRNGIVQNLVDVATALIKLLVKG